MIFPIKNNLWLFTVFYSLLLLIPDTTFGKNPNFQLSPYPHYLIGVEYYPWYNQESWEYQDCFHGALRLNLLPAQPPLLGTYDSSDPAIIDQHLTWCAEYGINLLITEWYGPNQIPDAILKNIILKSPRLNDLYFAIFYDWAIVFNSSSVTDSHIKIAQEHFRYLIQQYFSHPRYVKVFNNRPVVFLYLTRALHPRDQVKKFARTIRQEAADLGWDIFLIGDEYYLPATPDPEKLKIWDAIFGYDVYAGYEGYPNDNGYLETLSQTQQHFKNVANQTQVLGREDHVRFVPSAMPGFNDRAVRQICADNPPLARRIKANAAEGSTLDSALAICKSNLDTNLNMVHIVSFNEWHEDTQIEPTMETRATRKDNSPTGTDFTRNLVYQGYGMRYLEIIRDRFIAVTGEIKGNGLSLTNAQITVYNKSSGQFVTTVKSLTTGKYLLSRLELKNDKSYLLIAQAPGFTADTMEVAIHPNRTLTDINFNLYSASLPVKLGESFGNNVAISGNYPNPFNNTTTIHFSLPLKQEIELTVFDATGRRIRQLFRGYLPNGEYTIRWNGKNDAGQSLASGIYYVLLISPNGKASQKLLLIR